MGRFTGGATWRINEKKNVKKLTGKHSEFFFSFKFAYFLYLNKCFCRRYFYVFMNACIYALMYTCMTCVFLDTN